MEEQKEQEKSDETLTKDQILERSRKENLKNGDERRLGKMKLGHAVGFLAGIIALYIVELIFIILKEPIDHLLAIMTTMLSAYCICQACVIKRLKAVFIACAVIVTICAVLLWVFFGLQLAGIDF